MTILPGWQVVQVEEIDRKEEDELLEDVLCWLESHASDRMSVLMESCRNKFKELVS